MSDPIAEQASYWDAWNAENREHAQSDISRDQKETALGEPSPARQRRILALTFG